MGNNNEHINRETINNLSYIEASKLGFHPTLLDRMCDRPHDKEVEAILEDKEGPVNPTSK